MTLMMVHPWTTADLFSFVSRTLEIQTFHCLKDTYRWDMSITNICRYDVLQLPTLVLERCRLPQSFENSTRGGPAPAA